MFKSSLKKICIPHALCFSVSFLLPGQFQSAFKSMNNEHMAMV